MQPLQICIGPTIRIGQESWCLSYAGFFGTDSLLKVFETNDIVGNSKLIASLKYVGTYWIYMLQT